MPRRPRIKLAGIPQHIVQRGINREACFFAEEDYHCYLHWLMKSAADWRSTIHAYVLMTNHVHLLVAPETADGPARLMQSIGRRYVQYINRNYKRSGSLWEGRYKSSVVQAATYLSACMRYIKLNPVRAGMVCDPGQYRWSSYRANGLGAHDARLTPHPLYLALASDAEGRQATYRALFRSELDDEAIADIRLALAQGRPLGENRFAEAMNNRGQTTMMELKLVTDLIDALGKVAGGLKAMANLPKAVRETMRQTLDETYRLVDTTLNMVIIRLDNYNDRPAGREFLRPTKCGRTQRAKGWMR